MNTFIEIYDFDTLNTGYYMVFYTYPKGCKMSRKIDENHVNALLDMDQKEDFFKGKYKFKIRSEYDFKTIVANGEKRQGL